MVESVGVEAEVDVCTLLEALFCYILGECEVVRIEEDGDIVSVGDAEALIDDPVGERHVVESEATLHKRDGYRIGLLAEGTLGYGIVGGQL